ncbi:MAG TPA: hypothetical protein VFR01_01585 [Geobacterales bacterium]|nr:hypothetical protein [Geobacterales bacterium]
MKRLLILFCAMMATGALPALAEDTTEVVISPLIEYLNWKEYGGGSAQLRQFGERAGLQVSVTGHQPESQFYPRFTFGIVGGGAESHGTSTNIYNTLGNNTPIDGTGTSVALRLQQDFGWRVTDFASYLEPFVGVGYRFDVRRMRIDDVTGRSNDNYEEQWSTLYSRFGLRGVAKIDSATNLTFEGGATYPFYTINNVDVIGGGWEKLYPRGHWGGFAEIGMQSGRLRPSIYYEQFKLRQSDPRTVGLSGGPVQLVSPDTDMTVIGFKLSIILNN